jgi:hypothetical protein
MQDIGYKLYAFVLACLIVGLNVYAFGIWWGFVGAFITVHTYLFIVDEASRRLRQWARK